MGNIPPWKTKKHTSKLQTPKTKNRSQMKNKNTNWHDMTLHCHWALFLREPVPFENMHNLHYIMLINIEKAVEHT